MAERVPAEQTAAGAFIAEFLQDRGLTEFDLANDTVGLSLARVHDIIYHDLVFTEEEAKIIGDYFNTSAELWLNLQAAYFEKVCHDIAEAQRG